MGVNSYNGARLSVHRQPTSASALSWDAWCLERVACRLATDVLIIRCYNGNVNLHRIYILASVCVPRKCAPYMGALAAAGCAWSARGDPGYGGKWAGLARRGRCTPRSWAQRAVRVQMGAFSTAGARRLRAFLHCSSSHNRVESHWYNIIATLTMFRSPFTGDSPVCVSHNHNHVFITKLRGERARHER